MPITFEDHYLEDVDKEHKALIKSIANSIQERGLPEGTTVSASDREKEVRETVDWLADRMSVRFRW
ncbi:hypothetical protein [Bradyrhizobium sp. NBAIM01]|uniref:hypothetical protein n=1 Tax=Bradyrhizobium sp. NBAIM01 TaxID=2793818 RepID=UPI001CD35EE9|nr:hypothetical protein [Bradyrhizobium sp. NBAIM01]MCA1510205.1 hypothetical protein [Bradyrhizobium sp. NBAIM01]